jgi:NOL1/NOP2/sun family putative RNA methylase
MDRRKIPEMKPLFKERMQKLLGDEFKVYEEILKQPILRSIRCNTLKISPEKLKEKLENKGWKIKQPWKNYPEVMIVEGKKCIISPEEIENNRDIQGNLKETIECLSPGELGRALEHLLGYYYIQELASMLPIISLEPKEGEYFLDLCASPGSKTTQAAAKMKNQGNIIANEVSIGRLIILCANIERCSVTNTIVTKKDGVAFCNKVRKYNPELKFDKILVDAPCSGEGTLRSTPKTYDAWSINTIRSLSALQKQLFRESFRTLKVGGEMIYSTCTHAPEENEEVVSEMLNLFEDSIEILPTNLPIKSREGITSWEGKEYNSKVKMCSRIYPEDNNTEGFFVSKFRKLSEVKE